MPRLPPGQPAIMWPRPPIILAMRAGPGTSESRIAWLGKGDVVQIVDGPIYNGSSDWWLISDGSINAYVFGGYLKTASELDLEAPAAAPAEFSAGQTLGVSLGSGGANIRDEASAKGKKIGTLNEGAIVTVADGPIYDGNGGVWYLVDLGDDTRGYVTGEVFEEVSDAQVAAADHSGQRSHRHLSLSACRLHLHAGLWLHDLCVRAIQRHARLPVPQRHRSGRAAGYADAGLGRRHGQVRRLVRLRARPLRRDRSPERHLDCLRPHERRLCPNRDKVNQGEVIGEVGTTGMSTGPHVHFMLKIGDNTVDPLGYMTQ